MTSLTATVDRHGDSVTMPPGTYWVGDPCYGVPDDRWMTWLNRANYKEDHWFLLADLDGLPVLGISTAYGDGNYQGSDGNRYPVDAGMIGLVPEEIVNLGDPPPFGMTRYVFDAPVQCSFDAQYGTISIGPVEIYTDPPDEPDDYGDDPDDYYPIGEDL